MAKIANKDARSYVQNKNPFEGSNLYAKWHNNTYVVYSYGEHFPLFVFSDGTWFENSERVSVTTSKHRSQVHPHCETTLLSSTEEMRLLAEIGYTAFAAKRLGGV